MSRFVKILSFATSIPRPSGIMVIVAVFMLLWAVPMAILYALSSLPVFFTEGLFFAKAAFLTFGGAYAVLAYIAQAGVEQYAWLTGPQMMDGLGLAETTPGPSMAQRERPLSPFLHYRWQYTNTLSILHRITGVLLSLGFFILVYWLAAAAGGPEHYAAAVAVIGSFPLQLVLFGAAFALCYHLLNGVRHLFFDLGHGFELATARRSGWTVAIVAFVLGLVVWFAVRAGLGGAG